EIKVNLNFDDGKRKRRLRKRDPKGGGEKGKGKGNAGKGEKEENVEEKKKPVKEFKSEKEEENIKPEKESKSEKEEERIKPLEKIKSEKEEKLPKLKKLKSEKEEERIKPSKKGSEKEEERIKPPKKGSEKEEERIKPPKKVSEKEEERIKPPEKVSEKEEPVLNDEKKIEVFDEEASDVEERILETDDINSGDQNVPQTPDSPPPSRPAPPLSETGTSTINQIPTATEETATGDELPAATVITPFINTKLRENLNNLPAGPSNNNNEGGGVFINPTNVDQNDDQKRNPFFSTALPLHWILKKNKIFHIQSNLKKSKYQSEIIEKSKDGLEGGIVTLGTIFSNQKLESSVSDDGATYVSKSFDDSEINVNSSSSSSISDCRVEKILSISLSSPPTSMRSPPEQQVITESNILEAPPRFQSTAGMSLRLGEMNTLKKTNSTVSGSEFSWDNLTKGLIGSDCEKLSQKLSVKSSNSKETDCTFGN
ncbi:hypothetical protein HDU92_000351, partial [Lobulomyces angularis]